MSARFDSIDHGRDASRSGEEPSAVTAPASTSTASGSASVSASADRRTQPVSGAARTCRVPNCPTKHLDGATRYCSRHRICEEHLKALSVEIDGKEYRFCQKCSRLHELMVFDHSKHSCRASLELRKVRHQSKQQRKKQLKHAEAAASIAGSAALAAWQGQLDQYLSVCRLVASASATTAGQPASKEQGSSGSVTPPSPSATNQPSHYPAAHHVLAAAAALQHSVSSSPSSSSNSYSSHASYSSDVQVPEHSMPTPAVYSNITSGWPVAMGDPNNAAGLAAVISALRQPQPGCDNGAVATTQGVHAAASGAPTWPAWPAPVTHAPSQAHSHVSPLDASYQSTAAYESILHEALYAGLSNATSPAQSAAAVNVQQAEHLPKISMPATGYGPVPSCEQHKALQLAAAVLAVQQEQTQRLQEEQRQQQEQLQRLMLSYIQSTASSSAAMSQPISAAVVCNPLNASDLPGHHFLEAGHVTAALAAQMYPQQSIV